MSSIPIRSKPVSLMTFSSYLVFTDYGIYWIHRWEHHPICYKWLHKPHHKWISKRSCFVASPRVILTFLLLSLVPTPFASHAFHPLDGYLQSIPYHVFIFVFPFHRALYLTLFVLINFWTILVSNPNKYISPPCSCADGCLMFDRFTTLI